MLIVIKSSYSCIVFEFWYRKSTIKIKSQYVKHFMNSILNKLKWYIKKRNSFMFNFVSLTWYFSLENTNNQTLTYDAQG